MTRTGIMPFLPNSFKRDLQQLRHWLPRLTDLLAVETTIDMALWQKVIDKKLLPRLTSDFPLMIAICGGGSSGKSTLFNTLISEPLSPVGGTAGINRRVLVAAHPNVSSNPEVVADLFEPFETQAQTLQQPQELTTAGPPLLASSSKLPAKLVLMDTPDFDTGAKGAYVNRGVAREALDAADLIIYIFTNSNYNNRDNTDFIAQILTQVGMRKCFLIYRAYPSFTDSEVIAHATTVARNIYGPEASTYLLGIYRADEDNDVAAGKRLMKIRAVQVEERPLLEALDNLNPQQLRPDLLISLSSALCEQAQTVLTDVKDSLAALEGYVKAMTDLQRRCVQEALSHLPLDRIMKRFAELWMASEPLPIKWMRKTGSIVEYPFKLIMHAIRQRRDATDDEAGKDLPFEKQLEMDLLQAAQKLYIGATGAGIPHCAAALALPTRPEDTAPEGAAPYSDFDHRSAIISTPGCLLPAQHRLSARGWSSIMQALSDHKTRIITLSGDFDRELKRIVDDFRSRMGVWGEMRQALFAVLNVVPATAAVTYILSTGDPVGAVGIKVKLAGLLGLHDLYALVAIPATTGLKKADRKQLEIMLAPLAKAWLESKTIEVDQIFKQEITGELLDSGQAVFDRTGTMLPKVEDLTQTCREGLPSV